MYPSLRSEVPGRREGRRRLKQLTQSSVGNRKRAVALVDRVQDSRRPLVPQLLYQFLQALYPHRMVVEAFNQLHFLSAMLFEDVLILNADFYDSLEAVGCKCRRDRKSVV